MPRGHADWHCCRSALEALGYSLRWEQGGPLFMNARPEDHGVLSSTVAELND
jgi:hypothetical protein